MEWGDDIKWYAGATALAVLGAAVIFLVPFGLDAALLLWMAKRSGERR